MIVIQAAQIVNNADGSFAAYRITQTNGSIYFVPEDARNTDYQIIQQWIAAGNTPDV